MAAGPDSWNLHDLHEHLQAAVELELLVIPPYLCALYSLRPMTNAEASLVIRSVVVEEMLHMVLAANVLNALDTARAKGLLTVGMTGRTGGTMAERCDHLLRVPSSATPRIQEGHIAMGHAICQIIETQTFPRSPDEASS